MKKEDNIEIELSKVENTIKNRIYIIRGKKVMLDSDLADLYGIKTKEFNRIVKRNLLRFPLDFMFNLTDEEYENLRFQIGTSKTGRGGRRYLPYVFTEHGIAMLSSVLNSEIAVQMNIFIIRAFIKMRENLDNYKELSIKIKELEKNQNIDHDLLKRINEIVRHILIKPIKSKDKIGFNISE